MEKMVKVLLAAALGTLSYVLALMVAFAFFIASGFVSFSILPLACVVGVMAWIAGGVLESKMI